MAADNDPFDDDEPVAAKPLHDILTDKQVEEARAKAREKVNKERIAAAMKDVEEKEILRLKMEEGFSTGITHKDEIVDITIDLPEWEAYILINGPLGKAYHHGHTYPVPRHVADSLRETMFNAWRIDDQVEGRSLRQHYQAKRATAINARTGVIDNAPRRFDA